MLYFGTPPEPLTGATEAAREAPKLAVSEAHDLLTEEIVRYCRRETSGRSILISGSRGAGKTTLVRWAIDKARWDKTISAKPFIVALHGPALFLTAKAAQNKPQAEPKDPVSPKPPPEDGATETPKPPSNQPKSGEGTSIDTVPRDSTPATPKPEDAKTTETSIDFATGVLKGITKALYRSYVDQLSDCFALAVKKKKGQNLPAGEAQLLSELAASLQTAFDAAAHPRLLRRYWERAGVLNSGVIELPPLSSDALPVRPEVPSQGMRELIAAQTARDAYRLVVGDLKQSQKASGSDTKTNTANQGFDAKSVINPVLAILTGGAVGATLAPSTGPLKSALAGLAAAIAAAVTLNYTSTRTVTQSESDGEDFTWDTSLGSLDRHLPVLIRRILDAGLAPIFVIDELDKVENLETLMGQVIPYLKQIATERAFFCFLTDRKYFETVRNSGPGDQESTFFSLRLFTAIDAQSMRKYVNDNLEARGTSPSPDDVSDKRVLPFALTMFARAHPIELKRRLSLLVGADGGVQLIPGQARGRAYRNASFYQLVVEYLMTTQQVRDRILQEPDYRRSVYDALYYPARRWTNGAATLDMGRRAFAEYLEKQTQGATKFKASENEMKANRELEDLHHLMCDLAQHLAAPKNFRSILEEDSKKSDAPDVYKPGADLIPVVSNDDDDAPLSAASPDQPESRQWRYDEFGRRLVPAKAAPTALSAEVQGFAAVAGIKLEIGTPELQTPQDLAAPSVVDIEKVNQFLVENAGADLGRFAEIGLVENTPSWSLISNAIVQFKAKRITPEQADDIRSYRAMLERSAAALRRGLALASALAAVNKSWPERLNVLGNRLALSRLAPTARDETLQNLVTELENYGPTNRSRIEEFTKEKGLDFDEADKLALTAMIDPAPPDLYKARELQSRQLVAGANATEFIAYADFRTLYVEAKSPTGFLSFTSSMTLADWARQIRYAFDEDDAQLLIAILCHLGWGDRLSSQTSNIPELQGVFQGFGIGPGAFRSFPKSSLVVLEEPDQTGLTASRWIVFRGGNERVLPIFAKDFGRARQMLGAVSQVEKVVGAGSTRSAIGALWSKYPMSSEMPIAGRVILEKSPLTAERDAFGSLRMPFDAPWRKVPLVLVTSLIPTDPKVEIQAASLEEAIRQVDAIGGASIVNWMRVSSPPSA